MKSAQDLILEALKSEMEYKHIDTDSNTCDNLWIMAMAVAVIPFRESLDTCPFLPYELKGSPLYENNQENLRLEFIKQGMPTHLIRVVLRTGDVYGPHEYVDGTDIYAIADEKGQTADVSIWAESTWHSGPPAFHGGSVNSAIRWIKEMNLPFHLQLNDPFLSVEQQ